jgi:hypothetical protein
MQERQMGMDPYSNNRLANMEHEQRAQSAPVVPEYDTPNVEIQAGWLVQLALRFFSLFRSASKPLDEHRKPVRETTPCAQATEQHG